MSSNINLSEEYARLQEIEDQLDKHLNEKDNQSIKVLLIHEFNEVKDAAQQVIGHLAGAEGGSVRAVHRRLDLLD